VIEEPLELPTDFEVAIIQLEDLGVNTTALVDMDDVRALDLSAYPGVTVDSLIDPAGLSDSELATFGLTEADVAELTALDYSNLPAGFDYDSYDWEDIDLSELPDDFDWSLVSADQLELVEFDGFYDQEWLDAQTAETSSMAFLLGWDQMVAALPDTYADYQPTGPLAEPITYEFAEPYLGELDELSSELDAINAQFDAIDYDTITEEELDALFA